MGGGVAFLICIIFVMQFKISRKFWRRGEVELIKDKMAFNTANKHLKRKPDFVCLHLWANVLGSVSKVPGD